MSANNNSRWQEFAATLWSRFSEPAGHPRFVFYFLGIIVFGGALGIIIPFVRITIAEVTSEAEWQSVLHSVSTYVLAILAAALADAIVSDTIKANLRLFVFVLTGLVAGTAILVLFLDSIETATWFALTAAVFALGLWWISNADNAKLLEPTPAADAALGGPIHAPER